MTAHSTHAVSGARSMRRWIMWVRPQSYWDVVGAHLPLVLVTGIPLLLSFITAPQALPKIPCTLVRCTGYPCPFCGFTRSFWAISDGEWSVALSNCPLAVLLYLIMAGGLVWNAAGLIGRIIILRGRILCVKDRWTSWIFGFVSMLFIINWIYRLWAGLV